MALNNLGLGFVFTAKDMASGTIRRIGGNFGTMEKSAVAAGGKVNKSFVGLAAGAATAAVGVAGLAGGFQLAGAAGEFGKQLAAVGAVSQASEEDLRVLEKAAIDAGIATQFSPTEAVEGLKNLAVQGFNATEAATALNPALALAAGGQISVAEAARTTAASLRVFGLETNQAGIVADKLLRISNKTALQASDLALAIGNVSRGANLTKQSLDEMLPAIGLVRNTGVEASVASNSVSSALLFMAKNAKKFKGVGVEVTDAHGKFRPFMDIVLETRDALAGEFPNAADRAKKAVELFGRFGVTAFTAVGEQLQSGVKDSTGALVQNKEAIDELRGAMVNAGGAAKEFTDKLLDTFEGQKTLLKGTIQTLGVTFGKPLARVFKPIVTFITDALNQVIQFFVALPDGLQDFIAVAAIGGSLLLVFAGTVIALASAMALLAPFLPEILLALGSIFSVLGPLAIALGVVAAAIFLARDYLKGFADGMRNFFEEAGPSIRTLKMAVGELFSAFGRLISTLLGMPDTADQMDSGRAAAESFTTAILGLTDKVTVAVGWLTDFVDLMAEWKTTTQVVVGALIALRLAAFAPLLIAGAKLYAVFSAVRAIFMGFSEAASENVNAVGFVENVWKRFVVFLLGAVKGIAQAFDTVLKPLGIDFFSGAADDIEQFKELAGLTKPGTAGEPITTGARPTVGPSLERLGIGSGSEGFTGEGAPGVAAAAVPNDQLAGIQEQLAQNNRALQQQPIQITNVTELDGEQLAVSVTEVQRNLGIRGGVA